tara:strand:- start:516 stop:725 length:210 start_codon:yes stop_codon:yes gene_type:complete
MENTLKSNPERRLTATVEEIKLVLSALHVLHERAYHENDMNLAKKVMRLINLIKEKSRWTKEDELTLIN